jgi:hypothetical protein
VFDVVIDFRATEPSPSEIEDASAQPQGCDRLNCLRENAMLFAIKFLHSVVFIVMSAAILYVWYAVLSGTSGLLLTVAIAAILLESAVFVANGMRCPLTDFARRAGDVHGNDFIADIFLPVWFAPLIPRICGMLAFVGLLVLLIRALTGA